MSSDQVVIVVACFIVVSLVGLAIVALTTKGQMSGEARASGMRLRISAKRESESGIAIIEDSKSSHGGASATAPQKARISRTEVRGDIAARVDAEGDPKV